MARPGTHVRAAVSRLTSVLSVNAAISASVVLASRLVDDVSVFALMLVSIEAFALFPLLRRRLQVRACARDRSSAVLTRRQTVPLVFPTLTALASGLAVSLTAALSPSVACLYVAVFSFVTLAAPSLLVWAQQYKKSVPVPDLALRCCRHRTCSPRLFFRQQRNPRDVGSCGAQGQRGPFPRAIHGLRASGTSRVAVARRNQIECEAWRAYSAGRRPKKRRRRNLIAAARGYP